MEPHLTQRELLGAARSTVLSEGAAETHIACGEAGLARQGTPCTPRQGRRRGGRVRVAVFIKGQFSLGFSFLFRAQHMAEFAEVKQAYDATPP